MPQNTDLPFGTHALSPFREKIRKFSNTLPSNRIGRRLSALLYALFFRDAKTNREQPFDITIYDNINLRVYPATNRCEQKVFVGAQYWDRVERETLAANFTTSSSQPYIFLDIGSNIGLYSLFLGCMAKRMHKPIHIIAVEPDAHNRAMLQFNRTASNVDIKIDPTAIGERTGFGQMVGDNKNRGKTYLTTVSHKTDCAVQVETLDQLLTKYDLPHIDAMKIDIEGSDEAAIKRLFSHTPEKLWPKLLIIETKGVTHSPMIQAIEKNGYKTVANTKLNSIFKQ